MLGYLWWKLDANWRLLAFEVADDAQIGSSEPEAIGGAACGRQ